MDWAKLISSHFNVFMGLVTLLATVFIAAITYLTGRLLVLRIRKYIVEAVEISKAKELEHKKAEWEREYVNDFIIEPLIEYLEEGTEIINSLFSRAQQREFVEGLSNSAPNKDFAKKKQNEYTSQTFQRLANHQNKDTIAQARAKFLEDPELVQAIEDFSLYLANAKDTYEEKDKDGLVKTSQQAGKCALKALKRLSIHQSELNPNHPQNL